MISKKEAYNSIDLSKWIAAIFIIAIHADVFCNYNFGSALAFKAYDAVVRTAVPIFFISSGFFLFISMDGNYCESHNLNKIKAYILRIFKLYCIWILIYLPVTLYSYAFDKLSIKTAVLLFLRGFFFTGEQRFAWQLWYLLSLIFSLIFIYFLLKLKLGEKKILLIAVLFFTVIQAFDWSQLYLMKFPYIFKILSKAFYLAFDSIRIFMGIAYVALGMVFAKYKVKINTLAALALLFLGILGYMFLIKQLADICLFIFSGILFLLILKIKLPNSKWWYRFRKSSTVMYFTHMLFILIYQEFTTNWIYLLPLTLISTQTLSIIVLMLEKRFKQLKMLF